MTVQVEMACVWNRNVVFSPTFEVNCSDLFHPTKDQAVWFKEEFPYPKISQMVDVWVPVPHILVAKKFSIREGVPWGGLFTVQFSSLWAKVTRWDNESWDLQKWLVHPEIATVEIPRWLKAFASLVVLCFTLVPRWSMYAWA